MEVLVKGGGGCGEPVWRGLVRLEMRYTHLRRVVWIGPRARERGGEASNTCTRCVGIDTCPVGKRREKREGGGEVDRRLAGFRDRWRTKYGERPDGCFTEAKGHQRDGGSCVNKPVAVKEKEGVTYGRGGVGGGGRAG